MNQMEAESKTVSTDLITELVKQLAPLLKTDETKLAASIAEGIRQGAIDPIKEAQKKRARERGRQMQKATDEERKLREGRCSHRHGIPYVGLSTIAWAQQSDGVVRGVCQHCYKFLEPGVKEYEELVRVQTGNEGLIGR